MIHHETSFNSLASSSFNLTALLRSRGVETSFVSKHFCCLCFATRPFPFWIWIAFFYAEKPKQMPRELFVARCVCVCAGIWINDLRTVFRILSDFAGEEGEPTSRARAKGEHTLRCGSSYLIEVRTGKFSAFVTYISLGRLCWCADVFQRFPYFSGRVLILCGVIKIFPSLEHTYTHSLCTSVRALLLFSTERKWSFLLMMIFRVDPISMSLLASMAVAVNSITNELIQPFDDLFAFRMNRLFRWSSPIPRRENSIVIRRHSLKTFFLPIASFVSLAHSRKRKAHLLYSCDPVNREGKRAIIPAGGVWKQKVWCMLSSGGLNIVGASLHVAEFRSGRFSKCSSNALTLPVPSDALLT